MSVQISINGSVVGGLLRASISSHNYYSADSFSIVLATGAPPLLSPAACSALSDAYVEILEVSQSSSSGTLISGQIDNLIFNPIYGTLSLEGRDLSASLTDSYLQQDFVNQTASEVVSTIANQYELAAEVTSTQGSVGRYFEDGFTKLSLGEFSKFRSNWDLIVQLAREESFDVFVEGSTLFFQPVTSPNEPTVRLAPNDVLRMHLERNISIKPTPGVQMQSWNVQQTTAFRSVYPSGGTNNGDNQLPDYLFSGSNLTSLQADGSATQYAAEVGRLRTALNLEMPWDGRIAPRKLILLQETSSSFDGLYHVDCVERHYDGRSGSLQVVKAVSWPISTSYN